MAVSPALAALGLVVLYLLPGLGLAAAVFPERFRPARERRRALVEVAALAVVMSVAVTILFGEALQASAAGFSASWSDPTLELLDGGLGLAGLAVGALRGAFSEGPSGELPPAVPSENEEAWPALRQLERLAREERRIDRSLRRADLAASERTELERRRAAIREERSGLLRRRERDYAA